ADYAQGVPISPRHLAKLLEGFGIKAKQIRQGAATRKGYLRSDFTDAFRRYLPPDPQQHSLRRQLGPRNLRNIARSLRTCGLSSRGNIRGVPGATLEG